MPIQELINNSSGDSDQTLIEAIADLVRRTLLAAAIHP
ncbi:hypothetical protein NAS141_01626 [Sulfitobacter sp. NAS-14.1]|nr:hypothetical protein NAS141_01626 [Sulfitobacter sp. NAS-14.1]